MELKVEKFSQDIGRKMYDKRLNNRQASETIGVSKATMSRLVSGYYPDLITYAKVCKFLGCSLDKYVK